LEKKMPRAKHKEQKMPRPKAIEKMPRPKAKRTASSTATAPNTTPANQEPTDSDEEFLRLFVGATATEVQDEGNVEGGAEEEEEAVSIDPEDLCFAPADDLGSDYYGVPSNAKILCIYA